MKNDNFLSKVHLLVMVSYSLTNCASTTPERAVEKQKRVIIESISGDRTYMLKYEPIRVLNKGKQANDI